MKKLLYSISVMMLLFSCCNQKRTKNADIVSDNINIAMRPVLDSILIGGVMDIIRSKEHLKYPETPLAESFIAITFKIDQDNSHVYFSDSIVTITYNIIRDYRAPVVDYYKGMLHINGQNVAIFDVGGFGNKYYNSDSLKQVQLNKFKYYPMKAILTQLYYVENGELKYWNP